MIVDSQNLVEQIVELKRQMNAVILAHYYQRPEIQDIADHIGDSLALARIAAGISDAEVVVMCGVSFMAETVKLLCPDKLVLIPDAEAGCSLADSCPAYKFKEFIDAHPGCIVVSYVNTSAQVKALSDVLVTSGNALKVVNSLPAQARIIFGPDANLGSYINELTGRQMILWPGACHVHSRFSAEEIKTLKERYADAPVLVHPECSEDVRALADEVGSTAALLKYAQESPAKRFIVVTESGILHKMQLSCPDKEFIAVPAEGHACNVCEHMRLVTLEKLRDCLLHQQTRVEIDPALAARALLPINKMLELS